MTLYKSFQDYCLCICLQCLCNIYSSILATTTEETTTPLIILETVPNTEMPATIVVAEVMDSTEYPRFYDENDRFESEFITSLDEEEILKNAEEEEDTTQTSLDLIDDGGLISVTEANSVDWEVVELVSSTTSTTTTTTAATTTTTTSTTTTTTTTTTKTKTTTTTKSMSKSRCKT